MKRERTWDLLRDTLLYEVGIRLDTSSNLSCAELVEVGDILPQNGLKVLLAEALGVYLSRIHPCIHVHESGHEHANTWSDELR